MYFKIRSLLSHYMYMLYFSNYIKFFYLHQCLDNMSDLFDLHDVTLICLSGPVTHKETDTPLL